LQQSFNDTLSADSQDMSEIIVMSGQDSYIFRYSLGNEVALISCLMDYAADERYDIGWSEILSVIRRLGL